MDEGLTGNNVLESAFLSQSLSLIARHINIACMHKVLEAVGAKQLLVSLCM